LSLLRAIVLLATLAIGVAFGNAQPAYPKVDTAVEPTSGTVGERFKLKLTATVPDADSLQVLPLFDTQTTWTAIGEPEISDRKSGNEITRTYAYTIVPFETGQLDVPRVAFTYSPSGATSNTVLSDSLWVDVNSVLSGNGSASALRDVKPPVALSIPPAVIWTGSVLLAAVVALLAFLIWRRYSSHLKKMLGRALTPPELALKEMDALEEERLIEQKKIKEFYTRLSDTVRHYLETAYGVQATELTSNELLRAMDELAEEQPEEISDNYRLAMARLVELLDESDLVKFARLMPEPGRCRKALQSGREVVALTRYRFVEEDEKGPDGSRSGGHRQEANLSHPTSHAGVSE
jgi:hypothetical protein